VQVVRPWLVMLVVAAGVLVLRERLVLVQNGLLSPGSLVLFVLVKVLLLFRLRFLLQYFVLLCANVFL